MPHGNGPFIAAENAKRYAARQARAIFGHSDVIPDSTPFRSGSLPGCHTFSRNFPQPLSAFARDGEPWNSIHASRFPPVAVNAPSTSSPVLYRIGPLRTASIANAAGSRMPLAVPPPHRPGGGGNADRHRRQWRRLRGRSLPGDRTEL